MTADELAEAMGISKNTVRIHLRNINTKLCINSKSELLGKFIEYTVNNQNETLKRGKQEILILDDDESYVELMKKAAESTGYISVQYCLDGPSFLNYLEKVKSLEKGYAIPSFILLDLSMPNMNGFEVLSHLKADEVLTGIPVIIFSSSVAKEDVIILMQWALTHL